MNRFKRAMGHMAHRRGTGQTGDRGHPASRPHPAEADLITLLQAWGTNAETGLSPKEASKRMHRALQEGAPGQPTSLFATTERSLSFCIKRICREPILWLYLAVCVAALFFHRVGLGLSCMLLLLIHAAVCVVCLWRTSQIDSRMQMGDHPLCRVLRSGRVHRMSPDGLLCGDVICLYPGDTVPADVRLLSCTGDFTVMERTLDGQADRRSMLRLSKTVSVEGQSAAHLLHSPSHMAYAGGIVVSGEARALVIATGLETHLGGLSGALSPAHPPKRPDAFRRLEKVLNTTNFVLLLAVIPMVALGIFTLRDSYELLDMVLTVLTLCVTGLTGEALALCAYAGAALRASAASSRDTDSRVEMKHTAVLERLGYLDELVLVGSAGLHDGLCHPETLTIGMHTYDCTRPEADREAIAFAEQLYLVRLALEQTQETHPGETHLPCGWPQVDRALLETVCDWAELDGEAARLRVSHMRLAEHGVRVVWKNGQSALYRLSEVPEELSHVTLVPEAGKHRPARPEDVEALRVAYRKAVLSGYRVCFLWAERQGQACVEGLIAYAPHTCRKTQGGIRALTQSGIRVTACLRDVTEENTRVLSECGLTEEASASRPLQGVPRDLIAQRDQGVCAFEGCTTEEIMTYIKTRQHEGATVGVLSCEQQDVPLLDAADIAVSCGVGCYMAAREGRSNGRTGIVHLAPGAFAEPDGGPDSAVASDLCRRRADVLLRRVRADGGGLLGVRQALLTAHRFRYAMSSLWRFTLLSTLLRLLYVVLSLCCGWGMLSAPMLLLSGLCVDTTVCFSLSHADVPADHVPWTGEAGEGWRRFLEAHRVSLIALIPAALTPWIVGGIGMVLSARFGTLHMENYVFLSLLCMQIAFFMTDRGLFRRSRAALAALVLLICLWVGALAVALGAGLRPLWALIFPLSGAGVYVLSWVIGGVVERVLKKK